jgi:Yip1 domain
MDATQPASPYLTIWTAPRATIRQIVDRNPHYRVIFLVVLGTEVAVAGGFLTGVPAASNELGTSLSPETMQYIWRLVLAAALVVGPLFAILSLYASAALMRWAGGVLGGAATSVEVRAAIAWSSIPSIAAAVINAVGLGAGVISAPMQPQKFEGLRTVTAQFNAFSIVLVILAIWGTVIWLKCLGEVHGFSAWRALGASLLGALAAMGALLAVVIAGAVAAMVFMHHNA